MNDTLPELVLKILKDRYPEPATQLVFSDPWQLLVATILAAQCTDARVNQVTPALFKRWPGPVELAHADAIELEEMIRPTGFYHNKAKHLMGCAKMVEEDFGGQLPACLTDLVRLPGVARKTANVVMFAGFGQNEGIAVDTHVKRLSYRMGLTRNTDPVRIEKDLMALFPRKEWGDLNHRMVQYGRDVCMARNPSCQACLLRGACAQRDVPEKYR